MTLEQTRRDFVSFALKLPVAGWLFHGASSLLYGSSQEPKVPKKDEHFDVVVIGSGFGGTLNALTLARLFKERNKGERVLVLERGAWWSTPVETIQDKPINTPTFLSKTHGQPVRYWPSADHLRGLVDVLVRCFKRRGQEDGLYDITRFAKTDGSSDDGLFVAHANGVGGGSLIYSNMTIEPPDSVFKDWPISWDSAPLIADTGKAEPKDRHVWFDIARHAIGYGVLSAWDSWERGKIPFLGVDPPKYALNTGLSNIAARSARLNPQWKVLPDPQNSLRVIKQIDPSHYIHTPGNVDNMNDLWIDRARVFQTTAGAVLEDLHLPPNFGTADSSINDLTPEGTLVGDDKPPVNYPPYKTQPKNYCERQGRCVLGCLPGARQTLNKQLMIAMWGTPPDDYPVIPPQIGEQFLQVRALSEVSISPTKNEGSVGYQVHYFQRSNKNPSKKTTGLSVTADRVILAAGCIGTNELLLKCKQTLKTLPNLSNKLGYGFSTNGDYFAFVEKTKDTVNLTRGPVQTSFGHFFSDDASKFHTVEDLGIPRVFSVLFGKGFLRKFAETGITKSLIINIVVKQIQQLLTQVLGVLASFFQKPVPPEEFQSEDIPGRNIMGLSGMGRDAAIGQFRLGRPGETTLRVTRTDHKSFDQDPIFAEIKKTIDRFAAKLTGNQAEHASSPLTLPAGARNTLNRTPTTIVGVAHPLGGCRIAKSADEGVVDEYGRVFGYKNLYIADASIIPSSLGVNPSLTISVLALRIARQVTQEYSP